MLDYLQAQLTKGTYEKAKKMEPFNQNNSQEKMKITHKQFHLPVDIHRQSKNMKISHPTFLLVRTLRGQTHLRLQPYPQAQTKK